MESNISKFLNKVYISPKCHKFQVAPMVDVTNSNFRVFFRFISRHALLYTEMIHSSSILDKKVQDKKLKFYPVEKPLVLQIGGNDPEILAKASKIGEEYGYDEINLNCGCPSNKVQCGQFGACLMKDPELVGKCLLKMKENVKIPVTCKCRLGVDDFDSYDFFKNFVKIVYETSKIDTFIIHARKAFLQGLNPKENRTVPPLRYDWIYQIVKEYPNLKFVINGGIKTIKDCQEIFKICPQLQGVMLGRATYLNSSEFLNLDKEIFNEINQCESRDELLIKFSQYIDYMRTIEPKSKLSHYIKPLQSIYLGQQGNSKFKKFAQLKLDKNESFEERMMQFLQEKNQEKSQQKINNQFNFFIKFQQ